MSYEKPIHKTLDDLVEKLENLQAEKSNEIEDTGKVSASLDRLAKLIADLEVQRSRENKLTQKLEVIINQLEHLTREPLFRSETSKMDLELTLRKIIAGTRTFGQVIEIIANSAQLMFDSILKTFNEFKLTTNQNNRSSKSNSLDLAKVLEPMNTFLRGLATSMEKKSDTESTAGSNTSPGISSTQA
ncbi:hypothetical protein [Desulfofundulus sp.]|uniref:hypothetical protein n=1 Tax=Desulfofundulus sp. TaxID=2282750 RepID=UPI003C72C6A7